MKRETRQLFMPLACVVISCTVLTMPAIAQGTPKKPRSIEVVYTQQALRVARADYQRVPRGFVASYHDLDEPERLKHLQKRQLVLGNNPVQAKRQFERWMNSDQGKIYIEKRQAASEGLAVVMNYGLRKLPAVVIDGEYIFYGVSNLETAVNALERYQLKHSK